MKTLSWRHTDWLARRFVLTLEQEIIGHLTFDSTWNFDAAYTDKASRLVFAQKGWLDKTVRITRDGQAVGEIDFGWLGNQTLTLTTGEQYTLTASFWEQEVYWKNAQGETLMTYQQATMSSMGKGTITFTDAVSFDTRQLLVAAGLFARQSRLKRNVVFLLFIIPAMGVAGRM